MRIRVKFVRIEGLTFTQDGIRLRIKRSSVKIGGESIIVESVYKLLQLHDDIDRSD